MLFAFVAGAGTAISPCVLPVLPALLSAGATGGRRRPLGVVVGLAATFAITIGGLVKVVDGVGLGDTACARWRSSCCSVFGVALLVPRARRPASRRRCRGSRAGPGSAGDGFWSGLGVGAALGFVYAPCAGPILAAVISVGAARDELAVALAYALGCAVVLLALALGGRKRARPRARAPAAAPRSSARSAR